MKFLVRKWLEKIVKTSIVAFVAYLTGPKVLPVIQPVAEAFGWALEPAKLQAGLWVVLMAALNWLKHQSWTPKELSPWL